jgi:hypothetical protein
MEGADVKTFRSPADFSRYLAGVRQRLPETERKALEHIGEIVETESKALIGTEYPGWPALADSTVARKSALGQIGRVSPTDPLYATGEMRASVRHEVDANKVVIGTDDPVGVYHEFGTSRMPPRPFLASALVRKLEDVKAAAGGAVFNAITGRD